ncbi:hypothetical protein [Pantoea stewartii]|uniref:hypothetical protein n=1 Tax=Pantoea stewartii TaxID=66269 RepID=UPI001245057C|nr:hypothetical protein [Pantoea stewartii]KAB0556204.1 hypothetical protein F7Q90_08485 [Pantoea stewartii subsp. stewartii]
MTSKADYTFLDMLIQESVASGNNTFAKIDTGEVNKQAKLLEQQIKSEAFRIIDRRLQALRKKGLIKYSTVEKWTINYE